MVTLRLTEWTTANLFSKVTLPLVSSPAIVHACQHFILSAVFILAILIGVYSMYTINSAAVNILKHIAFVIRVSVSVRYMLRPRTVEPKGGAGKIQPIVSCRRLGKWSQLGTAVRFPPSSSRHHITQFWSVFLVRGYFRPLLCKYLPHQSLAELNGTLLGRCLRRRRGREG